ncbi:caspase family protein [Streptomyces sp. NPDC048436]|uniref:HD domain-containing protein n=1 Tax=Streptomyces sp. NPDC048436 TaxID=3365550 RepID=UPI00370FF999
MGHVRKALLIGIGHAPSALDFFDSLDEVVDADLRLMNTALDAAGYEVETLHNAGLSHIRTKIFEVARGVPADGTLLLYFSGHGVRVDGTDYLVPFDACLPSDGVWQEPYVDSLLPASISSSLKACTAGTVLWVIDACRTDLQGEGVAFGNVIDNGPPNGGFAVLTGCSAGERSGYTGEGSFFTRGLADALGPLTSARSVKDVFAMARAKTQQAARRHGQTQTARIRYGTNAETATREAEICEGRPLLDAWRDAVRDTPLWQRVEARDRDDIPRFQECLGIFVEQCARTLHLAQERLPYPDPWADDAFPVRLLRDWLPRLLPEVECLSAVEAAALAAAPFLREAAWADRLSQAAEVDPYALERRSGADAHRRHYEQIGDQNARVAKKLAECRSRGRTEDAVAVTMWLVHRWIADRFDTDDEAVPAPHADALAGTLLDGRGTEQDRVDELSGLLRAAAASIGLTESPDELKTRTPGKVLLPSGYQTLRIRPLASLLRLAAALAVDVRVFPEVVAEHLAVTDPVLPQDVIGIAHRMSWEREGNTLHLDAPCPHQAVHAALTEIAEQADQLAQQVAASATGLPVKEAGLLGAAPIRVTNRDLRPRKVGGQDSYEIPLLRFHLAQTEVRELLMGEQLYGGEPQLALRELYQNAMDACRYRAMRWAYLNSSGARPVGWSGQIAIEQGEDSRGRYIECRDNGVGMSEEQLKYTFTRAGSRFEQSKAFRREQSRWLRHDPSLRLYPNSRFGIGVFSYFMLADEMTIVTRQVSPDGIPAERAFRVDIPSSGSLFRLQRHDGKDDGLPEGGTRVRLYLRDGVMTDGASSCVNVLREQVRVSEFSLEVRDATGYAHDWEPGVLQSAPGSKVVERLESIPGVLWWVDGPGSVLCDGIITDEAPFGYVLNLTGPHAGQLSVSRKELQEYDLEWAQENWRKGAKSLASWSGLAMEWLWELERRNCAVARVLWDEWRGKGVTAARGRQGERHCLDTQGWFHRDEALVSSPSPVPFEHSMGATSSVERTNPWRAVALKLPPGEFPLASPADLVGHPVPEPGDADVADHVDDDWQSVVHHAVEHGMTMADIMRRKRRLRVVHPREAPRAASSEDLEWIPERLDGLLAEALSGPMYQGRTVRAVGAGDITDHRASLVLASHQLSLPLGSLARRYSRLTPLHGSPASRVPSHHEHYVCTEEDIEHLFAKSNTPYELLLRRVTVPQDVRRVSEKTGTPPAELLSRLSRFDWLGWTPPGVREVAPWMELDDDLYRTLNRFTRPGPDGRQEVGWAATVAMATIWQTPLEDAEERLTATTARLGLIHERHYADGADGGGLVPSSHTGAIVHSLHTLDRRLEDVISLDTLARAAKAAPSNTDLQAAVDELRTAGVAVPAGIDVITAWPELPLPARFALSGKEATNGNEDYPASEITTAGLFYAAERLRESLRGAWGHAEQHAEGLGLTVPRLPEDLAPFRPTPQDTQALTRQPQISGHARGVLSTAVWKPLVPRALAAYARKLRIGTAAAYTRLATLRPLGAIVPELSPQALDALPDSVPTEQDLVALSFQNWLPHEGAPLTTLGIVSIGARLGESIPDSLRRITPYLPLMPDPPRLPDPPPLIPLWQDLAVLTEGLNGLQPSVKGRVSPEHIARAAHATGESESWVADRLSLYAALFDLRFDGLTKND